GIECLRRFYPEIYRLVQRNAVFMTYDESSWDKRKYLFSDDQKAKDQKEFLNKLSESIDQSVDPEAATGLLSYLFPQYASDERNGLRFSILRPTNRDIAEKEHRICHPDYFPIYFRSAVPEEMFSNAEL